MAWRCCARGSTRGGGIIVSPKGVWKVLSRHGLNTRAKRLGLIAGYAAPYGPPRDPAPEQHIHVDGPGELVGIDCFCERVAALAAIDVCSYYAWPESAGHSRIHAGRPQTNGHGEALHKAILKKCWRPAFARYLYRATPSENTYLNFYNHDRVHHGRLTQGRIPHRSLLPERWRQE